MGMLFPLRQTSSKMVDVSRAAGPSDRVMPSGSVISSSSLASSIRRSSSKILSMTNMTSWRSVTVAVDDMTAVLDSCSLKHKSTGRACAAATTVKNKGGKGEQSEATYICKESAMDNEEIDDEKEEGLEDLELGGDTLGYAVRLGENQS